MVYKIHISLEKMIIDIVRHGETDWNNQRKWQGVSDIHLNTNGVQQAICLKKALSDIEYSHIYVSELNRATETVEIIRASYSHVKIIQDKRINERDFGELEGNIIIANKNYDFLKNENISPGTSGESINCIKKRISAFLNTIDGDATRVLIVTHGGIIKGIVSLLFDKKYSEIVPLNSCLYSIEKKGVGYKMLVENNIDHIKNNVSIISPLY